MVQFSRYFAALVALGLFVIPTTADAYIGPGAGLSAIGTAIAFIGAVVLLIVGFVWYPVKRLLKRGKADASQDTAPSDEA